MKDKFPEKPKKMKTSSTTQWLPTVWILYSSQAQLICANKIATVSLGLPGKIKIKWSNIESILY